MANGLSRDPYKNYRFRVKLGDTYVAGVTKVTGISRKVEPISFRAGSDDPTSCPTPGLTSFEPVTLSNGISKNAEFHNWASRLNPEAGYAAEDFRKDVTIEIHDDSGSITDGGTTKRLSYKLLNCWVSEYDALPDLNAGENQLAVQTIILQHEGFIKEYN